MKKILAFYILVLPYCVASQVTIERVGCKSQLFYGCTNAQFKVNYPGVNPKDLIVEADSNWVSRETDSIFSISPRKYEGTITLKIKTKNKPKPKLVKIKITPLGKPKLTFLGDDVPSEIKATSLSGYSHLFSKFTEECTEGLSTGTLSYMVSIGGNNYSSSQRGDIEKALRSVKKGKIIYSKIKIKTCGKEYKYADVVIIVK